MEATLLKDTSVAEMIAGEASKELDDILDEVVNLAETMKAEKLIVDNVVADGEEAVDETDFAMQTGDYLELEMDLPLEATEPQAKTTPLAEETESAFDALIDVENEVMAALAKDAGVNDPGDSLLTVVGKDSEDTDTEKSLAEDSNTREESVCDAPAENKVEDVSAPVGEAPTPQSSSDQLTDMLSKKIEATIARLVEERLSIIVERSIAEKFDTIFSSIG